LFPLIRYIFCKYTRLFIPCFDPSCNILPRNERHEQKWSRRT